MISNMLLQSILETSEAVESVFVKFSSKSYVGLRASA
jgi:hypothetical protein